VSNKHERAVRARHSQPQANFKLAMKMMKISPRMLAMLATLGVSAGAYGQGQVNFDTQGLGTSARVTDSPAFGGYLLGSPSYGPGAKGTNFFAQLYCAAGTGATSSSLIAVGNPVNFLSFGNAGWVQSFGTTTLGWDVDLVVNATVVDGGPVTIQFRVWWGGGTVITSYEAAVASANPNSRWGASELLNLSSTGNPLASPPGTPVDLVGLLGFQLIPEPGTVALAGLGAAALLLFRRRK